MPDVVAFPRPKRKSPAGGAHVLENVARRFAPSVRFKGDPAAAVRWAARASRTEIDTALVAEDALAMSDTLRMAREAEAAGDTVTAARLQGAADTIMAAIKDRGRAR